MNFHDVLTCAGLRPKDIVPDGRWRRCATDDKPSKRNGAYKLGLDGRMGWWRNWAIDSEPNRWVDEGVTLAKPIDPAILEAHRKRIKEERLRAAQYVEQLWREASPYRHHPYVLNKGLTAVGCQALRIWRGPVWVDDEQVVDDWLLVPMLVRGRLVNLQRINSKGVKRQIARAPQIASTFELHRPGAAVTIVVEGLATGLAVFQCIRHARVLVVFYADNLSPALDLVRPTGSVVIAADNDWKTAAAGKGNPGIEKARNAAELIDCGIVFPEGIEGTDWCDALKEWGVHAPGRIQREILKGARFIRPREVAHVEGV